MAPLSMLTKWSNQANWTVKEWAMKPDLWSLGVNATKAPAAGRVLVEFQHGVLTGITDGLPVGPYSQELHDVAVKLGALTQYSFSVPPDPPVYIMDLAKRGVAPAVASVILNHFGSFAVGSHVDPGADLSWLPIFGGGVTPTGEAALTYWPRYRAGLAAIFGVIRVQRPEWIVLAQDWHLGSDGRLTGGFNGLFTERYPTFNGTTLDDHARDKKALTDLQDFAGFEREPVHVLELRDLSNFTADYLDEVKAFAEANGFYLSAGRDQTATVLT